MISLKLPTKLHYVLIISMFSIYKKNPSQRRSTEYLYWSRTHNKNPAAFMQ